LETESSAPLSEKPSNGTYSESVKIYNITTIHFTNIHIIHPSPPWSSK